MRGGEHRATDCDRAAAASSIRRERFAAPPPAPENPTPVEAMAWRLRTPQGKQLYGLRKQTPEPVFGIIKSVMGFRQFLLRAHRNQPRVRQAARGGLRSLPMPERFIRL
jgi:hypothetical protein